MSVRFIREFDIKDAWESRLTVPAVPADDVAWGTVREVEPWAEVRLECAIGHHYGGRVRSVAVVERDSPHADGQKRWSEARREY